MSHTYTPPAWAASLNLIPTTRLSMVHGPTPLQPWAAPGMPEGVDFWIKRDDLTGMALSGNKIRKLEFLLAEAKAQGCDTVLTCGGIQSNHCRSTAVAARMLGMDSCLLLRTDDPTQPLPLAGNVLIDRLVGAEVIPISREQYTRRAALLADLAQNLRDEGKHPYVIPEGGSNALGTWGYIEAINELQTQLESGAIGAGAAAGITDLVFACGSGGTAAGLSLAVQLAGLPWKVHAVNVCDDATYFHDIIDGIYGDLGYDKSATDTIDMIDGYKGLGYAKSKPEELEYIKDIAATTGILLDPVYSGKAIFGLRNELHKHPERFQGNRILFLHTGGLFGLLAKAEEMAPQLPPKSMIAWGKGR